MPESPASYAGLQQNPSLTLALLLLVLLLLLMVLLRPLLQCTTADALD